MSYKGFVKSICYILSLFLIFHIVLYQFTKEALSLPEKIIKKSAFTGRCEPSKHVEISTIGDLARLSYLYRLGVERTVSETSDSMGYLNKEYSENQVFQVVTVGDSYMWYNGDDNRFTSLLQNKLNVNCYNMAANGVEDPFNFLQSNLKENAKVLIWEAAERNISADTFNMEKINYYFWDSKKKNNYIDRWDLKNTSHKQLRVINSTNIKFLLNNLSYSLAGITLIGEAGMAKLKNGKDLLFYKDDLTSFKRQRFSEDLTHSVDFISHIDKKLKDEGITLIFFAVPDKYNAYYDEIIEEQKVHNDTLFIERLTSELRKNDVIAVNLIDPYRNKISHGSDLYHFDDTHWNSNGALIAAELVAREIKNRELLD